MTNTTAISVADHKHLALGFIRATYYLNNLVVNVTLGIVILQDADYQAETS